MFGLTFLFPAILVAAGAAAAPVIIHLVMRTKPRRIVFPALRFVKKTHNASVSKLRLKHIILLAMRMLAIILIAAFIARWQIAAWTSAPTQTQPVAAVIIIDNSGSMAYRHNGQTLLTRAKQMAGHVIEILPSGSRIAIVESGDPMGPAGFVGDRKLAAKQIADIPADLGHASLAQAITRGVSLLDKSDLPVKEVYIATDMTAPAWRDAVDVKAVKSQFVILDCGTGQDTNMSLGEVKLSDSAVPVGASVQLDTSLFGGHVGGDINVQAELDGQPVFQQAVHLTAGQWSPLEFSVQPRREGVLAGRVFIPDTDPLDMDDVRYFSLQVGPPPEVLMVCDRTTDETYNMMRYAVSPRPDSLVRPITIQPAELTPDRLKKTRMVMLADVTSLADTQWRTLTEFVRTGGNLWIVAGPLMSVQAYNSNEAQRLMPVTLKSLEELATSVTWQAAKPGQPMLEPFLDDRNPPLTDVHCKGRFSISQKTGDADVVLAYADEVPAVVTRKTGDGLVVFWNFSPAPKFFAADGLAQFGVLTLRTARLLTADASVQTAFVWGRSAVIPLPKSMKNPVVTFRRPGTDIDEPVIPDLKRGVVSLPADRVGNWSLRFAEGNLRVDRGFAVNTDPAESDLTPGELAKVTAMFPPDGLMITNDYKETTRRMQKVTQPFDLTPALLIGLLLLLVGESYFANRFYKTPASASALEGPKKSA
ncbi:MAG: VWA domain-containing protein [Planctomycetaceae bacterium]|nr:MAG: VWA domain-containing protein [Planctomycetaceae bacterium]